MTLLRLILTALLVTAPAFAQEFEQVNTTSPQTLSNKTLTNPSIAAPSISGTVTGTPTIPGATLPDPSITGTVGGGASYAGPTITSPTITGTVSGGASYAAPTITSPSITGTVSGTASYTSPTITGTVGGSATYTTPTFTVPTIAGYATAGLPAAGTSGRLAKLTDGLGGFVLDNGSAWNPLLPVFNVVELTGSADAKITTALGRCPATGCVIDVRGLTGAVSFSACVNVNKPSIILLGAAMITGPSNACHFRTWTTGTAQSNVSIIGLGRGITTLKVNPASTPGGSNRTQIIELNDPTKTSSQTPSADYIHVAHLTLDGNKALIAAPAGAATDDTTHNGIASSATRYSSFHDIEAKNFHYAGFSFGLWPQYNSFSDIYTTNNGYSNAIGYGGILLGGTAIHNAVTNHISSSDIVGAQVYDNAQFNTVQGTYRNAFHAINITDQGGNASYGNIISATAYNSGSQALSIGGAGTQRNLAVKMIIDTTTGDAGAIVGSSCSASQFDLTIRRAYTDGLDLRGADNQIILLASENSQQAALGNYALRGTSALRNSVTLHAVDQQGTETQRAVILDAGSNYNLINGYFRGASSSVSDSGSKNMIRYVRSNGTNIDNEQLTAIRSISSTLTAGNNLSGTLSISDANTSNSYTFGTAEPDTSYFVTVTPTAQTGSPAAGSNRITKIVKTTTGFTVTIEVAPGAGTTQTFDWHLFR